MIWLFIVPALVLALASLRGEYARLAYAKRRVSEPGGTLPPATVIVPVKGSDQGLADNLAALASLDYPDYELIIAAHSALDIPPGVLPRRAKVMLAHGRDPNTGEKIQNLVAGLRITRKRSEVIAFADSDGRVTRGWLRALVAPLEDTQVGAVTGYRWYTPAPATFWGLIRSVWNAVIAGSLGPGNNRFVWAGAMAIRKDLFFEIRVPEYWKGCVSDDYGLSAAVRQAGLKIAYAPGATVACADGTDAREFLSWARRQMTITRIYDPGLWWPALIAHVVYCAGMIAAVIGILTGVAGTGWALLGQLLPGMVKGGVRARIAAAALPDYAPWFRRWRWVHWLLVPLATWIWLISLIASGIGEEIHWRGYQYRLKRPEWARNTAGERVRP